MSRRKKNSLLSIFLDALLTLIVFAIRVIAWLIRVIPQIIYFFWSICGYSQSEYYQVTHKPLLKLVFDKGAYGEYLIYRHLDKKLQENHKWLFNIYLPRDNDRTTEIDVMLFCGSGIYVFESKNYKGWIFGSENRRIWTQCVKPSENTRARKYRFLNPIMQNKLHLTYFKKQLTEEQLALPIHSVILFGNRCSLKKIQLTSGKHTVIRLKELTKTFTLTQQTASLCPESAWQDIYALLYPMTQVSEAVKQKHIDDINAELRKDETDRETAAPVAEAAPACEVTVEGSTEDVAVQPEATAEVSPEAEADAIEICPKCGGKLVERTVKSGANQGKTFMGCSNFPRCRYTK